MPDFQSIENNMGWSIWSAIVEVHQERRDHILFVITNDSLHSAQFTTHGAYGKALDKIRAGIDPQDVFDSDSKSFYLDEIDRVVKAPEHNFLTVKTSENSKKHLKCPDDLGDAIFHELRQRLRSRLRFTKEKIAPLMAMAIPLGGLIGFWFIIGFLMLGAGAKAEEAARPSRQRIPGEAPKFEDVRVTGAKALGGAIGIGGLLGIGGVITFLFVPWMIFAVVRRPMQKVLQEGSGSKKKSVRRSHESDDADEAPRQRRRPREDD